MIWILDHFGLVVFLVVVFTIGRKIRSILKDAEEQANRRGGGGKRPMANFDPDEAERVRRIQEEIRRKIAERRGGTVETQMPTPPPLTMSRPQDPPALDPFGGPMKRMLTELERRVNERTEQSQPPVMRNAAEEETEAQLKRQRELAKKLQAAREARAARQQDPEIAGAVVRNTPMKSAEASVKTANEGGDGLLTDLRDPRGLRRAFVLREVLGAPVGLR